jgi:hypothetical protein
VLGLAEGFNPGQALRRKSVSIEAVISGHLRHVLEEAIGESEGDAW